MGSGEGVTHIYIDEDVVDGMEYTYTLTAYDMGVRTYSLDYVFLESSESVGEDYTDSNDNGLYDDGETFIDSNGNGLWDREDSIRVLDENGLLISQRYNEKAINLTTFSIENKFKYQMFANEVDFKYTFGNSNMYEPFASKSEWEYVRSELDPRIGDYTLYLRNGSNPGVSYYSSGMEEITGVSYDHLVKIKGIGSVKFGLKRDRKERDF